MGSVAFPLDTYADCYSRVDHLVKTFDNEAESTVHRTQWSFTLPIAELLWASEEKIIYLDLFICEREAIEFSIIQY